MCFLLSHCGVTNAVYHTFHFSSTFMPPSACLTRLDRCQALSIDLESGSVPWPRVMDDLLSTSEAKYFAIAWVPIGLNLDDYVALFFEEDCATWSFFIAAFPSNAYPLSQSFQCIV
jgi:hypothetical protein